MRTVSLGSLQTPQLLLAGPESLLQSANLLASADISVVQSLDLVFVGSYPLLDLSPVLDKPIRLAVESLRVLLLHLAENLSALIL